MTDSTQQPDADTAASMDAAARNAQASYPQTSGDLDPQAPADADGELDQAMQSIEGVRAYLDAATDDDDRLVRADRVETAEAGRDQPRKGVSDLLDQARS